MLAKWLTSFLKWAGKMTLISLKFFVLLSASLIAYYALPKKQKYVLFITSLVFFAAASKEKLIFMTAILFLVIATAYFGSLLISSEKIAKKRLLVVVCSLAIIVANLVVLKYLFNVGNMILSLFDIQKDISFLDFAAPIGLSYFSLNAIGYVLDVYWQSYRAEKNPVNVALFINYFPQIVSGPVTRFSEMNVQFNAIHAPDYDEAVYGIRRMIFGYMKKLVVADRLGQIVLLIYQNDISAQSGVMLFFGVVCYAFQLYADFSGCMDIILGTSKLYGISLPENFDAPFFSRTLPEFWRRWHISLGNWFRDYVMYPILKTNVFQSLGQKSKKAFGKKYGKKIPTYLSTVILWALIGLWHGGTGYYFMASAVLPGVLLIFSDITQPLFSKKRLPHFFQSLRTFCIMLICWTFVCTQSVSDAFGVCKQILFAPQFSLFKSNWAMLNLPLRRAFPLLAGFLIMIIADTLHNRKTPINTIIDKQPLLVRIAAVYTELALVLLFGLVGQSSFIYFKF